MSGLCHVAKERYCEPHGLFTWSEVQNVLQNMPLQKFLQIDLGFGHDVPIFLVNVIF